MIISGTGHRPDKLGGYGEDVVTSLVSLASEHIGSATKVISGMALGWDTALALAAVKRGIPLVAAVPFKGQERMWPKQSQERYIELLNQAEEVVYVCEEGYAPWKMQVRNKWMTDNCDLVLALWNGSKGGTSNCVQYANQVNKPIKNLWKEYFEHLSRKN